MSPQSHKDSEHRKRRGGIVCGRLAQMLGVGKSTVHCILGGRQEPPGIVPG